MPAQPHFRRPRTIEPPRRERVELILHRLDQLPTLSAAASRLLSLTMSEEASARDVVKIIEHDAALTAAILRLARRADLGVRSDIITVERAVTLLGFNAVRLGRQGVSGA